MSGGNSESATDVPSVRGAEQQDGDAASPGSDGRWNSRTSPAVAAVFALLCASIGGVLLWHWVWPAEPVPFLNRCFPTAAGHAPPVLFEVLAGLFVKLSVGCLLPATLFYLAVRNVNTIAPARVSQWSLTLICGLFLGSAWTAVGNWSSGWWTGVAIWTAEPSELPATLPPSLDGLALLILVATLFAFQATGIGRHSEGKLSRFVSIGLSLTTVVMLGVFAVEVVRLVDLWCGGHTGLYAAAR